MVERIIADRLPYVTGTPVCFSFAEFNGRHLIDNASEVMFSLFTSFAASTGLTPPATAEEFPYLIAAH